MLAKGLWSLRLVLACALLALATVPPAAAVERLGAASAWVLQTVHEATTPSRSSIEFRETTSTKSDPLFCIQVDPRPSGPTPTPSGRRLYLKNQRLLI